jgi:antitoxin PrlF
MATTLELESTLTDRYQTTVPDAVRRALKLGKRDKIRYLVQPDGQVVLTRAADSDGDDPALAPFLAFLAHDIASHPERLVALDAAFVARLQSVVRDVEVNLDAPLAPEDE